MTMYSVRSVPVAPGEDPQWEVLKDGIRVAGPFLSIAAANEEIKRRAFDDIFQEDATKKKPVDEKVITDGRYIGKLMVMNQYYLLIDSGIKLNIVERLPIDQAGIELIIDKPLDFTLKNGKARSNRKEQTNSHGMGR